MIHYLIVDMCYKNNHGRFYLRLEPVLFLMLHHPHDTPTFKTEVLCFVSTVELLKRHLLLNEWLI